MKQLIDKYNEAITDIYKSQSLSSLGANNFTYKNINVLTCPSNPNYQEKKFNHLINLWDLINCSNDLMYFTSQLFLHHSLINNPLEEFTKFGNDEVLSLYHQNLYDRRYSIFITCCFEKCYNYWDRIGDRIASFFPELLKIHQVDFARIIDRLESSGIDNENFQWLLNFKNNEYQQLNNHRKNLVHYSQYEANFRYEHAMSSTNTESLKRLWKEKSEFPEYFKSHLGFAVEGYYQMYKFLESLKQKKTKRRIKDSTITRVQPSFDFIGNDVKRLNKFFHLFGEKTPIIKHGVIHEIRYGKSEKTIPPSKSLLKWMLQNLEELKPLKIQDVTKEKSETQLKRELLFAGDKNALNEALNLISAENPLPNTAWYIFEGYTHPDIYIETDDSIFIGEAKRTESDITTKTTWLNQRDQFIRHIDSLLEQPKKIYSFYLLDKDEYQKGVYPERMKLYQNFEYFKSNLRHRNEAEIKRAMESFIGFIFWDDIAECFEINFPDTINDII